MSSQVLGEAVSAASEHEGELVEHPPQPEPPVPLLHGDARRGDGARVMRQRARLRVRQSRGAEAPLLLPAERGA